ncbi:hypothetical protein [Oricola nitratireducens]|uniref:hypothetical protein n=1 Tax=Oricola nitratireducens TaxID=2775868 RepID=UPI00186772F6|nr:hypothetical protein [Oricola nitratireducens]
MSQNPEAFDYLRKQAYGYVHRHGRDRVGLFAFCREKIDEWRTGEGAGSNLDDDGARRLARSVAKWTVRRYNPPRPRHERSREQRAACLLAAPAALEFAEESYGKATVRGAARIAGLSKSTLGRQLNRNGIMPMRDRIIAAMPKKARDLVRILDETQHCEGTCVLRLDDLCSALWDGIAPRSGIPLPALPRSTRSTRRKRMRGYLDAVSRAGLGYRAWVVGDHVTIRRGRRFRRIKDIPLLVEDATARGRVREVRLPRPEGLFWEDRWVRAFVDTLRLGCDPHPMHWEDLLPLLDLMRLAGRGLLDPSPLLPWIRRAIDYWGEHDFLRALDRLAAKIEDRTVKEQAWGIVGVLSALHQASGRCARDFAIIELECALPFRDALRREFPESHARVRWIQESVFGATNDVVEALARCSRLSAMEAAGEWAPPSERELERFRSSPAMASTATT